MTDPSIAQQKARILFVEDEFVIREHLTTILSDDYLVEGAADGEQALRAVLRRRPDLIVTDLLMPGMNGIELVRTLRSRPSTATIPVLMTSGRAPDEMRLQGFESGADSYLAKPYTERELRVRIRSMLEAAKLRTDLVRSEERERAAIQALADRAALLESITDAFYAVDRDWRVTYVNQRALDYFGRTREQLIGKSIWDEFPAGKDTVVETAYRRAMREQRAQSFELMSPLSRRWIEIHAYPTPQGLAINFRDITERKKAVGEWQLHTHILESLTEGVSVSKEDGTIIFTNAAEDQMFGYEPGELIGMNVAIQNAYPPQENERVVGEVMQHLRERGSWSGEWHNKRKDGTTFFTQSTINSLQRDGERFWVCVQRDVSQEKAAKGALLDSEERYRAFVANSTEAIWRYELDPPLDLSLSIDEQIDHVYKHGSLAELNDAMARMYGYERAEDLVGAPLAKTLPPGESALEYLRSIAEAGYSIVDVESTEADRDGNVRHFSNSLVPVIKDGKLFRAWGTQRDITDRKTADELLRDNEKRKDEFLAVLAHELRNPLAPIRNGLQILRLTESHNPTTQGTVSIMDRQMTHLVRLVDDLLDVSRINSGRLDLKRERVLLSQPVAAAVEATAALIEAQGHRFVV
ncbi:MAG TPA: PAS domain S-box protein, partial [Steroidobacteraceae bacterium]|nr:PAS domain S-box protein [Steroidobacteraceae bacterium]